MSSQETEIMKAAREAAILIPSLEPDGRLPAYIRKLSENDPTLTFLRVQPAVHLQRSGSH